jgi:hypothetical protein
MNIVVNSTAENGGVAAAAAFGRRALAGAGARLPLVSDSREAMIQSMMLF